MVMPDTIWIVIVAADPWRKCEAFTDEAKARGWVGYWRESGFGVRLIKVTAVEEVQT